VKLSATVYLPRTTSPAPPPIHPVGLPAIHRRATASQVSGSPNRFTTIGGAFAPLLPHPGYGVMDNPTMPIVRAGETANDSYVEQLVASAEAAVNKIVEMGVATAPHRRGGHSYGAFHGRPPARALALFRAGAARSGAYNRHATPFGFQNEQRTFGRCRRSTRRCRRSSSHKIETRSCSSTAKPTTTRARSRSSRSAFYMAL